MVFSNTLIASKDIVIVKPNSTIRSVVVFMYSKPVFALVNQYLTECTEYVNGLILARSMTRSIIKGEPPSPINPPRGCRFHPRCPHALDICSKQEPPAVEISNNRTVFCWLYTEK